MHKTSTLGTALTLAFGGLAMLAGTPALAQETLQRVTVTGTSIKRLDAETALPVSVITREQIERSGAVNVEDILRRVSASSAMVSDSTQGAGYATSNANLRGLGANSTLVLLNGRRLANHPFGSIGGNIAVDLNSIPFAAIERIEVLRDGASAIYGTDAVAGVINFITRKDYRNGEITARYGDTEDGIGGRETGASIAFGMGDLSADRYNLLLTGNFRKLTKISALEQKLYLRNAEEVPGSDPPTSGRSFPGRLVDFNITPGAFANAGAAFAPCDPNYNVIQTLTGQTTPNGTTKMRCRYIYPAAQENLPDSTKYDLFGRLNVALNAEHQLFVEASFARNHSIGRTAAVPIDSTAGHVKPDGTYPSFALPITSKYFPSALLSSLGYTPADFNSLGNGFTEIATRSVDVGPRTNENTNDQMRLAVGATGLVSGWDYDTAINLAQAKGSLDYFNYLHEGRYIAALATGNVNPFGPNDAAGIALLDAARMEGRMRESKSTTIAWDGKISKELMAMAGGNMAIAIGADLRREKAEDIPVNADYEAGLHIGGEGSVPRTVASRNIYAVFGELSMPFAKGWEATLAARYDKYSDFGGTFNPQASLRFQPTKEVLLRGSVGTGFRAPTLWDVNSPTAFTNTANSLVDPDCPAGFEGDPRCETQFNVRLSSDPNLKPEKSRQSTAGIVVEPSRNVTASLDYWYIEKTDQIGTIGGDAIMADPVLYEKYKSRIHRLANGFISYIETPVENLGDLKTSGLDLEVRGNWPLGGGRLGASFTGTYVFDRKQQNGKGEPFTSYEGTAGDGANVQPVPTWQHTLGFDYGFGDWVFALENVYVKGWTESAGLVEANVGVAQEHKVKDSSRWNASVSWKALKGLTLRLGARNLFDQAAPFTAVSSYGSHATGFAGSFVDPRDRFWYVTATYQFK
ncbi:TonB-dependent receptor plug domain-containing protein [Roseateles violae]|uniref:TonB-dependent receptor n=1 Tax=Roseateles violae TaxID=3058042 RepID=A0ABT8DR22_9BURK|nr:TonB-dependent receptor [Pelomonas sp. PFR6]MDN3919500.1 TonB-dependent receptor [Pelomonas sp. PFR6]